eukprot:gene5366-3861_t
MTAHHLLSAATTPFGSPMVVPPANEKAGAELQRLVDGWHAAYPERSVPDIWALVSHKATTSLGGPRVPLSIGRTAADSPLAKRLAVTPARIPEDCLDARRLKRLLADQGLSLEQMVALVGCDRMAARGSKISAAYFSLLLTEQWRPVDAPHGTRVYRCRREVPGAEREQDPCNGVELRGIDMLLLQDPGLKAFVERFSANPRRLHTAIEDVFAKIQDRGHNVNRLKEVGMEDNFTTRRKNATNRIGTRCRSLGTHIPLAETLSMFFFFFFPPFLAYFLLLFFRLAPVSPQTQAVRHTPHRFCAPSTTTSEGWRELGKAFF